MPINYKDNQKFVVPLLNEGPGRRTGWELKKEARKDSDGFEIFDDYWSDSSDQSSISADSTIRPVISTKRKTVSTPSNTRKISLLKPMSSFSSGGFSTKSSNHENSAITTEVNTTQHASPKALQEGDLNGSLSIIDTSKAPNSALQSFKTKKRLTFSAEEHLKQASNKANEHVEAEPVITNVEAEHQHDIDHNSGEELNNTVVADEANELIDCIANGVQGSANKDNGQVEIDRFQTSPQAEKTISDRSRRGVAFNSHTVTDDVLETGNYDLGTGPEYSSFISLKHKSVVNVAEKNFENDNGDSDTDDDDHGFDIVEIDTSVYTQSYGNSRKSLANNTKNSKLTSGSDCDGQNGKVTVSTRRGTRNNNTDASQLVNESVNEAAKAAKNTAKNRSKTRKRNTSSPASRKWDGYDDDGDEDKVDEEEKELASTQPKKASSYRNKGKTVTENTNGEIGSGISDGIHRDGKTVLSVKKTGRTRKKQATLQEKSKSEKSKKAGKRTFDEGTENLLEDDDLENNNHDALVIDIMSLEDDVVDNDTGVNDNGHKSSRKSGRLTENRRKSKLTSGSESSGISDGEKVTVSAKNKTRGARTNKTQSSQLVNVSETDTAINEKNTSKSKNKTQKENISSPGRQTWNEDDDDEEVEKLSTNQPKKSAGNRNKRNRVEEIRSDIDDENDGYGKTLSVKRTGRTRKKQEPLQGISKSEKRKKSDKKVSDEETEYLNNDDDLENNDHDALVVDTVQSDDDAVDIDTDVNTNAHKNSKKSGNLAESRRKGKLTSGSESGGISDSEEVTVSAKNKKRGARTIKTQSRQLVDESETDTAKNEKNTSKSKNKTQKENISSPGRQTWNEDDNYEEVEEELSTNQPKKSTGHRNKRKTVDEIQSDIDDETDRYGKTSIKRTGKTQRNQETLHEMAKSEKRKKSRKKTSDEDTEYLNNDDDLESNDHNALVVNTVPSDDEVMDIDTGVNTKAHKNSKKSRSLSENRRKGKLTSGSESGGISDGEDVTVSAKNKRRGARTIKTRSRQLVDESETDTAKNEKNTIKSKNKTQKENISSPGRQTWNEDDNYEEVEEELSTNQPKKSTGYRNKRKPVDEIQSDIGDDTDRYGKTSIKRTGRTQRNQETLQEMAKSEKRKKSRKKTSDEETECLMNENDLESNDHDALVVDAVPSDDTGVNTNGLKNSRKSESLAESRRKGKLTSGSENSGISDCEKVTISFKNRRKGARRNKTQANHLVSETQKTAKTTAKRTVKSQKDNTSRQAMRKWYDIEDDLEVEAEKELEEKELSTDNPKNPSNYKNRRKTETRIMDDVGDSVEEVAGDVGNLEELSTNELTKVSSHKNNAKLVTGNMDDEVNVNDRGVETLTVKRTGRTRKKQKPLQEKAKPNLRKKSGKKTSDKDTENLLEDNDDHDALVVDTMSSKSAPTRGPRQKSKSKHLQDAKSGDIEDNIGLKGTDDGFTESCARTSVYRCSTASSLKNGIRNAITEPATKGNRKKRSKSLYNPENDIFEGQKNDENAVKNPTMITGSDDEIQVKKKGRQQKSIVRFSVDEALHSASPRRSITSTSWQATAADDYDDEDDFPLQITKSSGLHQTECADDLDRALENDAMPSTKKKAVKRKKKTETFEDAEGDVNVEDSPTAKYVKKTLNQKSPSPSTRQKKRGGGNASSPSSTALSSEEAELIKRPRRGISQQKRNFDQTDLLTHSQFGVDDISMSFTPARVPSGSTPVKSILKSGRQRKTSDSNVQDNAHNRTMKFFEVPRKKAYIIDPPEVIEDGLRRTKRHRVQPLEYWRNERPIYEKRKSGGFSLLGIQSPTIPTPSPPAVKQKRKRKVMPKTPQNLSIHTDLSDVELEEKVNPTVTVINPSNDEEVEIDAIVTGEMNQFYGPTGKPSKKSDNISICKCLYQKSFSAGELIIRPLQEKGLQFVRNDTVVFRVLRGKVAVKIHETVSVLESGAMFFIPKGNVYNIKNLRKDEAKLVFIQVKGSIKS